MTDLARLVGEFASILAERPGSDLDGWKKQVREAGLTELDRSCAASTRTTTPQSPA